MGQGSGAVGRPLTQISQLPHIYMSGRISPRLRRNMKPLKELKPTTIWKYRSDLRKYQRMTLDKSLSPEMRAWAASRVRHFEE